MYQLCERTTCILLHCLDTYYVFQDFLGRLKFSRRMHALLQTLPASSCNCVGMKDRHYDGLCDKSNCIKPIRHVSVILQAGVLERRVAELRKTERAALLDMLTQYPLLYKGHEGYAKV